MKKMSLCKIVKNILIVVGLSVASIIPPLVLAEISTDNPNQTIAKTGVRLVVLGTAQDAGYPQISCYQPHCMRGWENPTNQRLATSLGLIDDSNNKKYLFEATPDIKLQMYRLHLLAPDQQYSLSGIFITHAHMGHYTGLMHLGREAMGGKNIAVYAMPKMAKFLTNNGPWEQLVGLKNIEIKPLQNHRNVELGKNLSIQPFLVPHRDEYSETVGYKIKGPNKTALFIPDINKWQQWKTDIRELIKQVDYAFLDATFYSNGELPNRDMSEVPHPFVEESIQLFDSLNPEDKAKVIFIHFNHSNPLLMDGSAAQQKVLSAGFNFATEGMSIVL